MHHLLVQRSIQLPLLCNVCSSIVLTFFLIFCLLRLLRHSFPFFFFNDTATTEIYTLSPTRRSSDLGAQRGHDEDDEEEPREGVHDVDEARQTDVGAAAEVPGEGSDRHADQHDDDLRAEPDEHGHARSEEHTSELQSPCNLVCRLLLE